MLILLGRERSIRVHNVSEKLAWKGACEATSTALANFAIPRAAEQAEYMIKYSAGNSSATSASESSYASPAELCTGNVCRLR